MNKEKLMNDIAKLMDVEGLSLHERSELLADMMCTTDHMIAKTDDGDVIPQDTEIKTHGIQPSIEALHLPKYLTQDEVDARIRLALDFEKANQVPIR